VAASAGLVRSGRVRAKLHSLAGRAAVPVAVQLELTQRCNLRCCHCYLGGSVSSELPTRRWLELVAEIRELGCMQVSLTGGEIALRGDWLEIAERVRQLGMMLTVLTNGTLMAPEELDQLAKLCPSRVSVSIYGPCAAVHEAVTGVAGSFEKSVATVRHLTRRGIRVRAAIVLMRRSFAAYGATRDFALSLGCEPVFDFTVDPTALGGTDVLAHRLSTAQLNDFLLREIVPTRHSRPRAGDELAAHPRERVVGECGAGSSSAFVSAAGGLYPCVGFLPGFGSVATRPFKSAWHSEKATRHRRRMSRVLAACQSCEAADGCVSTCPRRSLVEMGDSALPTEWSCHIAKVLHDSSQMKDDVNGEYPPWVVAGQQGVSDEEGMAGSDDRE